MKAYVINLDSRIDRWNSVNAQSTKLNLEVVRISAIDQYSLPIEALDFSPMGVVATWFSHQKACSEFLKSGDDYGLIMEDDFVLERAYELPGQELLKNVRLDFLQMGYLRVTPWESIDVSAYNIRNRTLRLIRYLIGFLDLDLKYKNRKLIVELSGTPKNWVAADIRPGGQAYLVSRKFAAAVQNLNLPTCMSTDGFYEALGKSRSFNMFRLQKSIVGQSNSPSSVAERFING